MYARIALAHVGSPNSPRVASLGTDLRRLCDETSRGAFGHYCEDCGVSPPPTLAESRSAKLHWTLSVGYRKGVCDRLAFRVAGQACLRVNTRWSVSELHGTEEPHVERRRGLLCGRDRAG